MRKITHLAVNAFWTGKPFYRSGNGATEVTVHDGEVLLLLHGNAIARRPVGGTRLEIRSAGYQTNTTKERLNGVLREVGGGVYQTNFVWYFSHPRLSEPLEMSDDWLLAYPGSDLERLAEVKRQAERGEAA